MKPSIEQIGISFISIAFTLSALAICVYTLFYSPETTTRTQAIYWFCIALAAAVVPYLKVLAPYIKRVKVGDVEVELNELRKEVQSVQHKVSKLDEAMMRLSEVSQREASLPTEFREFRGKVFSDYATTLDNSAPEEKLAKQEYFSQMHLRSASMDISQLKEALDKLGYYHGSNDESFSPGLAQSIEKFQSDNVAGKPDGIAGPITLSAIRELLISRHVDRDGIAATSKVAKANVEAE